MQCCALQIVLGIPVMASLPTLSEFSLIVDAFFGFSFHPPVREPFAEIIDAVTKSGIFVFSIDIPSGTVFFYAGLCSLYGFLGVVAGVGVVLHYGEHKVVDLAASNRNKYARLPP